MKKRARRRAGWTPEITMIRAVLSTNEMQTRCTRTGKPVISRVKRPRALSQSECGPMSALIQVRVLFRTVVLRDALSAPAGQMTLDR